MTARARTVLCATHMAFLKSLLTALKTGLRVLSPDCCEASRLQSEALDHSLSRWQRFGLRIHLLLCKWCRRYGRQLLFLRRVAREHPDRVNEISPQALSPEARERLKQSLRDQAK
jgi:hypothetical protein